MAEIMFSFLAARFVILIFAPRGCVRDFVEILSWWLDSLETRTRSASFLVFVNAGTLSIVQALLDDISEIVSTWSVLNTLEVALRSAASKSC